MIVDMHRHLWSVTERYPRVRELAARSGHGLLDTISALDGRESAEARGSEVLGEMDAAGVRLSVLVVGDYGLRLGDAVFSIQEENEHQVRVARSAPDRLLAFYGIDPRRPEGVRLFRDAVERRDVGGLKLHPGAGFSPSDRECYPFYEVAGHYGIPVAIHTGPMAAPLLSRTAHPLNVDEAAADFPDTTFVMQHAGQSSWREALNVAFWKPNVMLELSMWQWEYIRSPSAFAANLATMRDTIGADRLLFASDFPGLRKTMALPAWIEVFKDLSRDTGDDAAAFSQAEVEAILGGNAKRILRARDGGERVPASGSAETVSVR
jgi:predicted TIM-barrel fold metal-dependent hydrolase